MSVHGELAGGAAQRRRERRLRSWLRHERQTVAMVLAEACHHSSGSFAPTLKERRMAGQDADEALRDRGRPGQLGCTLTSSWSRGCRGGSRRLRARAMVVLLAPSLPHFAGGDTLDALTLSFLVQQAVLAQEKEKEEKKRKEKEWQDLFARRTAEYVNSLSQSSSSEGRRGKRRSSRSQGVDSFLLAVDVPVIMPQIQFIHRRSVFQLWRRDKYTTVHTLLLQVQFLDTVLDMPRVLLRQVPGLMVQKTVVLPQLQSIACRRHFLLFRRGRSSRSRLLSRPQRFLSCCLISGSRCFGCAGRAGSFHRRGSEAVAHGPDLPSEHCLFPVAEHGGRCPCWEAYGSECEYCGVSAVAVHLWLSTFPS